MILRHIGDHIRRHRLDLGLSQRQVGLRIGVNAWTILDWETREMRPSTRYIPAVLHFLGYDPFPPPSGSLVERLRATRVLRGLSQRAAAELLGVDKHTVWGWERGRRKICGPYVELVERFLLSAGRGRHQGGPDAQER